MVRAGGRSETDVSFICRFWKNTEDFRIWWLVLVDLDALPQPIFSAPAAEILDRGRGPHFILGSAFLGSGHVAKITQKILERPEKNLKPNDNNKGPGYEGWLVRMMVPGKLGAEWVPHLIEP